MLLWSQSEAKGYEQLTLLVGVFPANHLVSPENKEAKRTSVISGLKCLVIKELRPTWVIGENVANFVNMALEEACADLESAAYEVQPFIIPACAVEAPHQRQRVFIIGHVPDTECNRHQGVKRLPQNIGTLKEWRESAPRATTKLFDDVDWEKRAIESGFLGRNNGIPHRMDRIKCVGNAVSPQQVYPILQAIADIERGLS